MPDSKMLKRMGWLMMISTCCTTIILASDGSVPDKVSEQVNAETTEAVEKRSEHTVDGYTGENSAQDNSLMKRYGLLLGNGFSTGKRESSNDETVPDEEFKAALSKKWLGDIYGGGYGYYGRNKRDLRDKKFIRYFGNVLGGGFSVGKRDGSNSVERSNVLDGAAFGTPIDSEPVYENDDIKRYIDSAPGYRFLFGKREMSPDIEKRYFNSDMGTRFLFKRNNDGAGDINKRYGFTLGRGFSFGKRRNDKRPFGHMLGSGFTLGKRQTGYTDGIGQQNNGDSDGFLMPASVEKFETSEGLGTNKRYGWLLGRGLSFGKRSDDVDMKSLDDIYFIDDNGNIQSLNKKSEMTQDDQLAGEDAKRYGFVLGNGFAFGKRDMDEDRMDPIDEDITMNKRYGFLLGRGFAFGKRIPQKMRYGSILGQGLTFGKREE